MMKVYFPCFYTEAHRTPEAAQPLVDALRDLDIHCRPAPRGCDLTFCGSIFCLPELLAQKKAIPPVVHYNWDLYPHMIVHNRTLDWRKYLEHLETCKRILVPNSGTAFRTMEYAGRESHVVLSSVRLWEKPLKRPKRLPLPYALDVMRDYEWDPNRYASDKACKKLGIPLVRTLCSTSWDDFRSLVSHASVLLSCYQEASTGGLTLLEGYAHGVPCLVANSELNGAGEYFKGRARYFQWDSSTDLETNIREAMAVSGTYDASATRRWVEENFSEARLARDLKREFDQCF